MVSFIRLATATLLASTALGFPHGNLHQKRASGKRGAAYNDASLVSILSDSGAVTWAYNWAYTSGGTLPSNVEFVPMLWGSKMFGGWPSAIESALAGGSQYILGFNEPDMPSQANLPVSEAAAYYKQYITPYADKATLVTPAVTNGGGAMGLNYMANFLSECSDCQASVMAIHWYGLSADDFKSHVISAVNLAQQHGMNEVWITEFALNGASNDQSAAFLEEVLPWLDSQAGVGRYAFFMCSEGRLTSGDSLSASGQAYVSA